MASSSTSSIHNSHEYDVFLSFRGEDTRKNFVDHLYKALQQQGIRTFKDDERLEKGKRINDDLMKSIDDSKFCIIIFSKKYASSSWCLDELVKIMESHKNSVYPVFYDVDPSEVRKQNGKVGKAFSRHANEEGAERWREALKEAANLSGWDVRKTAVGHEAKVIKLIVEWFSLLLRSIHVDIDENLIGIERRMLDLHSCLEIDSNDVRMIGIKGMGGAGKTTLARAIFDRLSIQFEAKSFVENVREVSKASPSGLRSLQENVLRNILKDQGITLDTVHDGKRMMKMRFCSKKVLFVLDDVDSIEQLEALAGALDWFKPGSRIIITTRDEQVLVAHKVELFHDVTLLSDEEAIRLLSRHAFGSDDPKSGYETQTLEAVHYAAGLPLTIRVLGSSLCGKSELEWRDALKRLETIPLKKTLEKLEISYESLEDDHKEIFLDVTCFMKGWDTARAIEMLETFGFHARNGLRVLEQRSLITLKRDFIDMHDHIEELGKNIVCRDDPHKRSRLWIQEEIEDVLADDMGTEATRWVDLELTPEIVLEGLGKMKKLRCLRVNEDEDISHRSGIADHVIINEAGQYFSSSLCYLSWPNYPHWCLPKTFRASNLVALQMCEGGIKELWPNRDRKVLKKLKFLDLRYSKIRTLDLGMTPNLERLELWGCEDLEELHLPKGCQLQMLVNLTLSDSKRLKSSLSFIKQLESLEILNLSGLSLGEFPDIIPGHSNSVLLELRFHYSDIEELPSSIGNLHKLVRLVLHWCRKLKTLPRSVCSLQHLQILDLECCGIEEMPEELGKLTSLMELNLSFCKLREIPSSIGMLKNLRLLKLACCDNIETLPNELGGVACLEELRVGGANVKHLPDSICMLKHLKVLDLSGCKALEHLPEDVGQLESLVMLDLAECNIRNLPSSIGMLKHLKELILRNSAIDCLPENIGQLESLRTLHLHYCCNISNIPSSIGMLKCLEELKLDYCYLLVELPDELGDVECLRTLTIDGSSIRHLPECFFVRNKRSVNPWIRTGDTTRT